MSGRSLLAIKENKQVHEANKESAGHMSRIQLLQKGNDEHSHKKMASLSMPRTDQAYNLVLTLV